MAAGVPKIVRKQGPMPQFSYQEGSRLMPKKVSAKSFYKAGIATKNDKQGALGIALKRKFLKIAGRLARNRRLVKKWVARLRVLTMEAALLWASWGWRVRLGLSAR